MQEITLQFKTHKLKDQVSIFTASCGNTSIDIAYGYGTDYEPKPIIDFSPVSDEGRLFRSLKRNWDNIYDKHKKEN